MFQNLFPFGRNKDVYTEENILHEQTIEEAKLKNLSYQHDFTNNYNIGNKDEEWNKLDNFLKSSNIASADYHPIIKAIYDKDSSIDIEELSELEHIRWGRFHYINYWRYGIPEDGKYKDADKRKHTCLVDYEKLDEINKDKDRVIVKGVIEE